MKILYTNFHKRNGGGHVSYIINLARALAARHEVVIATPDTSRLYATAGALPGVRRIGMTYARRITGMLQDVKRLRKLLKSEAFDVVHVNGVADHRNVMLARMTLQKKPAIVWTKHNTFAADSVGNMIRARLGTDACIAVCDFVARILRDSPYGAKPVQVVRLGVDVHHFVPADAEEKAQRRTELFGDLPADTLVLGSTGGTDLDKGWLILVEAVSRLDGPRRARFRVVVAGDPPSEARRAQVADLGMQDQVVFPGLVKDVRNMLGACDVGFVVSFHEAGSYATCESLASGLPTLVSDAGGLPELVTAGQDGWVVPTRDVDATVTCLVQLMKDEPQFSQMGLAARQKAMNMLSTQVLVEATEQVYQNALNKRGLR